MPRPPIDARWNCARRSLAFAEKAPDAGPPGWTGFERCLGTIFRRSSLEIPAERMSEICKRFTLELLLTNQERLLA